MTRSPLFTCAVLTGSFLILPAGNAQILEEMPAPHTTRTVDASCASAPSAMTSVLPSQIHIKILLVEFKDVHCAQEDDSRKPRYTARDFEDLLGSDGKYVSPRMYSPDGDELFGSMNDYFTAMSGGRLRLTASVLNRLNRVGVTPQWIRLGQDEVLLPRHDDVQLAFLRRGGAGRP